MKTIKLKNTFENLEDIKFSRQKCIRCNMCKFPPLSRVENHAHSMGCPAYEEFLFSANSGGGMVIMSDSLHEGRSEITDAVQKVAYGCTLCGLCDVSCKFGTDIEVFETLLLLRKKIYDEGVVYPEHAQIIENIKTVNHPLLNNVSKENQASNIPSNSTTDTLIWVGSHFAHDTRLSSWLNSIVEILNAAGFKFRLLLDDEPTTGRAALEIGDLELFKTQSKKVAAAINDSGAKEVLCLSAEDYSTLRSQLPKYAKLNIPVKHITQVYAELIANGNLELSQKISHHNVAWHDPCYLGRLGGEFEHWEGYIKTVNELPTYEPARKINYGSEGVFKAPRTILDKMTNGSLKEFSRRNEYAFNAGESGQASAVMPEFTLATAKRRLQEADDLGIKTIVTECPQAYLSLHEACKSFSGMQIVSLTQLISLSI